jgi:hypothetical protein
MYFRLVPVLLLLPLTAQVRFATENAGKIDVTIDGQPSTSLYFGEDINKPYLWPLRSADGKIVTRRWPMEKDTGESHDHVHHRGVTFSVDEVNGVKFWGNDPSFASRDAAIGKIVVKGSSIRNGAKSGTLTTTFDWTAPNGKVLLNEHRVMTFYSGPQLRIIDFDITLAAANEKVVFGDTKEGAFAIRLADSMSEKKGDGQMVNAEGKRGMDQVWGHRSNWVDYSGTVDGEKLGVAILDASTNPRHPVYWHSRDYGLFALNPFGQHSFDPSQPESHWTLDPGKSLHFCWRVVIHSGDAASAGIGSKIGLPTCHSQEQP